MQWCATAWFTEGYRERFWILNVVFVLFFEFLKCLTVLFAMVCNRGISRGWRTLQGLDSAPGSPRRLCWISKFLSPFLLYFSEYWMLYLSYFLNVFVEHVYSPPGSPCRLCWVSKFMSQFYCIFLNIECCFCLCFYCICLF